MVHALRSIALILPLMLGACAADLADRAAQSIAPEPVIRITGELAFRDGPRPRAGSIAVLTVSDFASADDGNSNIAEKSVELGGPQLIVPFELEVAIAALQPGVRYVLRAAVRGAEGATTWRTEMAQIIDTDEAETDVGVLMLTPASDAVRFRGPREPLAAAR